MASIAKNSALLIIDVQVGLDEPRLGVWLFISNILNKFAVTFVSIPGITLVKEQRPHLKEDSLN